MRLIRKHHVLVRLSHWLQIPLLAGLVVSGLAIYWAAPVFKLPTAFDSRPHDLFQDASRVIAGVLHTPGDPRNWIYDHLSVGRFQLANALRLHWFLAYPFMLVGLLYAIGLAAGGGWRALLPRRTDIGDALAMIRFYLGVVPMAILRRSWPHPTVRGKYNALQRAAYVAVPLAGLLIVLSGWAMHKPVQLGWLERLFVNYDGARIVHFVCMVVLAGFVIPHVVLVFADGWDTFRSMVTGWSLRVKEEGHE